MDTAAAAPRVHTNSLDWLQDRLNAAENTGLLGIPPADELPEIIEHAMTIAEHMITKATSQKLPRVAHHFATWICKHVLRVLKRSNGNTWQWQITLSLLLCHTAGLPREYACDKRRGDLLATVAGINAAAMRQKPGTNWTSGHADFIPGSKVPGIQGGTNVTFQIGIVDMPDPIADALTGLVDKVKELIDNGQIDEDFNGHVSYLAKPLINVGGSKSPNGGLPTVRGQKTLQGWAVAKKSKTTRVLTSNPASGQRGGAQRGPITYHDISSPPRSSERSNGPEANDNGPLILTPTAMWDPNNQAIPPLPPNGDVHLNPAAGEIRTPDIGPTQVAPAAAPLNGATTITAGNIAEASHQRDMALPSDEPACQRPRLDSAEAINADLEAEHDYDPAEDMPRENNHICTKRQVALYAPFAGIGTEYLALCTLLQEHNLLECLTHAWFSETNAVLAAAIEQAWTNTLGWIPDAKPYWKLTGDVWEFLRDDGQILRNMLSNLPPGAIFLIVACSPCLDLTKSSKNMPRGHLRVAKLPFLVYPYYCRNCPGHQARHYCRSDIRKHCHHECGPKGRHLRVFEHL